MIAIRAAEPAEAESLTSLALRSKASWGYDADFMRRCADALTVTAAYVARNPVFVALEDGDVVGFYALETARYQVELDMLFVEPAAFGRGAGRELLGHARVTAARLGFAALFIESDPGAERFYAAAGAARIGTVASTVDADRLLPLLRLDLNDVTGDHD